MSSVRGNPALPGIERFLFDYRPNLLIGRGVVYLWRSEILLTPPVTEIESGGELIRCSFRV